MSIARLANQFVAKQTPPKGGGAPANASNDQLESLTKYLPAETISLYVAFVGASGQIQQAFPQVELVHVYWLFAVLTPVMVFLLTLRKFKIERLTTPFKIPAWRMFAALLAYLVWGAAIPGILENDATRALLSLAALVVSFILSLLEPFFDS